MLQQPVMTMRDVVILTLLFGAFFVEGQESKKEAEDCQEFAQLARNIEAFTKQYKTVDQCKTFSNCSGIHCNGTTLQNPFSVSFGVEHCQDPVQLWLHLKAPKMNIDEWKLLRNGAKVDLVKDKEFTYILPIQVSAYLLPKLERKNGNLTIGARFCLKILSEKCQDIGQISLPVSDEMCSVTGLSTQKSPTRKAVETTMEIKTTGKTTNRRKTTAKTESSSKEVTTKSALKTTKMPVTKATTHVTKVESTKGEMKTSNHPMTSHHSHQSTKKANAKGQKGNHAKNGLSTGAKVALVTSVLLAALLFLGLLVYWRKLKRRRPAYYNDINVNREDDEEPFFDSHLVL